jgi:RNA polymerase sigma factor (sigma-70 family)
MTTEDWENIIHDRTAYKKLYVDYFKKFYNYGKKFTTNTSLIEDSIQEVFLDFWARRQKMSEVNSLSSYFFSSFRYILLRKIKEEKKVISSEQFEAEPAFSIDIAIINQEITNELQAKLKTALDSLTPRQREAIFLRFYQNLSYEEVADVLAISVKATYKIVARSLSALKENLSDSAAFLLLLFILKSGLFK